MIERDTADSDAGRMVSNSERGAIQQAHEQLEQGQVFTDEQANSIIDQWLNK